MAEIHEGLGRTLAIAAALWAVVRGGLWLRNIKLTGPLAYAMPVVSIAGALLVVWTAYYGGQLVFDLGVNVASKAAGA